MGLLAPGSELARQAARVVNSCVCLARIAGLLVWVQAVVLVTAYVTQDIIGLPVDRAVRCTQTLLVGTKIRWLALRSLTAWRFGRIQSTSKTIFDRGERLRRRWVGAVLFDSSSHT